MSDLLERHRDVLAPVISYTSDIEAVSAEGLWITGADGRRYADFACGIGTTNLGHCHPAVVEAAVDQLRRFEHAGGTVRYEAIVRAGERLREVTPEGIERFVFANSGAEAVEASVKLTKHVTGRQGVVVFRGGFHGRTMGSVSYTTSAAKYRKHYHPILSSVFVAPFPHPYRWGMAEDEATSWSLDELDRILRHEVTPDEVACLLVEPVQGEGGYYPAPPEFLTALRALADRHGILLVFDEVQTGFGRTAAWFAADRYGIAPDILVMGKAIANGLPLSAIGASSELLERWPPGAHGSTFGGNPVSCAASVATIEAIGDLLEHARGLSKGAFARFQEAAHRHPSIGEVRGLGLMIGVELVRDPESRQPDPDAMDFVISHGHEHELLLISCGPDGNVIRFLPPLIAEEDDVDRAVDVIEDALAAYAERA